MSDLKKMQNYSALGVNLSRQKYGPLDVSNVFYTTDAFKWYLKFASGIAEFEAGKAPEGSTKPVPKAPTGTRPAEITDDTFVGYPYEGQIIAVEEDDTAHAGQKLVKVYVLGQELDTVKTDGTWFDYAEVGSKTLGDEKSIHLDNEGSLSIKNYGVEYWKWDTTLATPAYVKVTVSTENPWKADLAPKVYNKGTTAAPELEIGWFEPNPTEIEGLTTRVTTLENTVGDSSKGLVKGLADETSARTTADTTLQTNIDAEATARETADTTLQTNIDAEATARETADNAILALHANKDASTKKTVAEEVTAGISALDVQDITGFGANKTLATLTETDGKIAATFQDISITESQISDLKSYKTKQTAYDSGEASANQFVTRVQQNANGEVTVSKASVDLSSKQDAFSDGSATTASVSDGVVTLYSGVNQSGGTISAQTSSFNLAKVATTGTAADVAYADAAGKFTAENVEGAIKELYDNTVAKRGAANGFASLDSNTKVPLNQLPDIILGQLLFGGSFDGDGIATISNNLKTKLAISDSTIQLINSDADDKTQTPKEYGYKTLEGVYFIADATFTIAGMSFQVGDWLISTGTAWKKIDNTDAVTGVKGDAETDYRIGNVNITPANIGLGNVNNTSDADKPVSTAQQSALDLKVNKTTTIAGVDLQDNITKAELLTALNVADGAQVNVIEKVKLNGSDLTPDSEKRVNLGNLATSTELSAETSARESADTALGNRIAVFEANGAHDVAALEGRVTTAEGEIDALQAKTAGDFTVGSGSTATTDIKHYVDDKDSKKADKVTSATNGNFAGLDANGNLTDSGKKAADFATAAQGAKADSAIQTVKVNGTALTATDNAVNVTVVEGETNGTIKVNGAAVAVHGLGTAAYTASTAYATAAQGTLADSALQSVTIAGKALTKAGDVAITAAEIATAQGLKSAAYSETTAFDAAGTASTAISTLRGTYSTGTLGDLDTRITTNATNIATNTAAITTLNGAESTTGSVKAIAKSYADGKDAAITAAQTTANQGVSDAAAAQSTADSALAKANTSIQGVKVGSTSLTPTTAGVVTIPAAAAAVDGYMSKEDKVILDNVDEAISGAVEASVATLDATITGMAASKTLKTLSEADGIIAATFEDIAIAHTQVTDWDTTVSSAINTKIATLDGSATIASVSSDVVTLKAGVVETDGIIANSNVADITLAKVAKTGTAADVAFSDTSYTATNVSTALVEAKTAIAAEATRATGVESGLDERIQNLEARGRFLSNWNASTGAPTTYPVVPEGASYPYTYNYKSGDYYIVGSAAAKGSNYQPTGSSITKASATADWVVGKAADTREIGIGDYYTFDGTAWVLISNSQKTVSFENIAGDARDNTSLNTEFTTIDSAITALETDSHTHSNKTVLDGITADDVTKLRSDVSDVTINGTSIKDATTKAVALPLATASALGLVKVDDDTIAADANGVISVKGIYLNNTYIQKADTIVLNGGNA